MGKIDLITCLNYRYINSFIDYSSTWQRYYIFFLHNNKMIF